MFRKSSNQYLTPEMARAKALAFLDIKLDKELSRVFSVIEEAAENGAFCIELEGVSSEAQEALEELGYEVSQATRKITTVSWRL